MEVLIASIALIAGLKMFLDFKREEREDLGISNILELFKNERDQYALEIATIKELKAKVDTLSLKVGLR